MLPLRSSQTRAGRYTGIKNFDEGTEKLYNLSKYIVGHDIENINNYPSIVVPVIKNDNIYCTVQTFGRTYSDENTFAVMHIHDVDSPGFIHHTNMVNNRLKYRNYRIGRDSLWALDPLNVICFSRREDEEDFARRMYKINKNPLQIMHIAQTTGDYDIMRNGVERSIAYMIKKGRSNTYINIFYKRWKHIINRPLENIIEDTKSK